jgi:hypothetical protein
MALQGYWVQETTFNHTVRKFLKRWHYSDYVNIQAKHTFCLFREGNFGIPEMVGVCVYTRPAGPTAGQSYYPEAPDKVLELRRLCLIDETPKNAEVIPQGVRAALSHLHFDIANQRGGAYCR